MAKFNELKFQGELIRIITQLIAENPYLPFSKISQEDPDSRNKRKDLLLLGKEGNLVLSGELKLPDRPEGKSPYNETVIRDAHSKADEKGIPFFFTYNVNDLVLWQTFKKGASLLDRNLKHYKVLKVPIYSANQLNNEWIIQEIKLFFESFLKEYSQIYYKKQVLVQIPPDEKFISVLDSHLEPLIQNLTIDLVQKYQKSSEFKTHFRDWYVNEQGWTFAESNLFESMERASKLGSYILIIKLVFYEALRKKFKNLPSIDLSNIKNLGSQLKAQLNEYFNIAVETSGDYETVYDFGFGDHIPFISNQTVLNWKELTLQIDQFDFTRLDYEVIGLMFQRLISPKERHKYGQHFTRSDVVDLILCFTVTNSTDVIMDPACGGGSFLVRAYNRLKYLNPKLTHTRIINQLFGVDIAGFPIKLAIMNLASRELIENQNYPRVFRKDFFNVKKEMPIGKLPADFNTKRSIEISLNEVNSFVGNLPYIRQELIPTEILSADPEFANDRISHEQKTKKELSALIASDLNNNDLEISKRSDLHSYFWYHCYPFLPEGSRVGFLTSSMWLDNDYGLDLQKYFLDNFKIVALIESKIERWFPDANVATTITVLERCSSYSNRLTNITRFVQITQPLNDLIDLTENDKNRWSKVDQLVSKILKTEKISSTDQMRVYPVKQKYLYDNSFDDEGNFIGYNWSKYIRAPQIYFKLRELADEKFVPVSSCAKVRFGVKTGANEFFYVKDITDSLDNRAIKEYGIKDISKVRIVESGDGSYHLIESKFLFPIIFSLKEISLIKINSSRLAYKVVSSSLTKQQLSGTHLLNYIKFGEKKDLHLRPTCAGRKPWYNTTSNWNPTPLIFPSKVGERFLVAENVGILEDKKQYGITPDLKEDTQILLAIMNSTLFRFFIEYESRQMTGAQAISDIDVNVVSNVLIPSPATITNKKNIIKALSELKKRDIQSIFVEVHKEDRKNLDDEILKGIGITEKNKRDNILSAVYNELVDFVKSRLQRAESVKKSSKKTKENPRILATEILKEINLSVLPTFPESYIKNSIEYEKIKIIDFDLQIGEDIFTQGIVYDGHNEINLGSKIRAEYLQLMAKIKKENLLLIPITDLDCENILSQYFEDKKKIIAEFFKLVASRTKDQKLRIKLVSELLKATNLL